MPGASVVVTDPANGLQRTAITNDEGNFVVAQLPASTYLVRVERQGFSPTEVKGVALNVNDHRSLRIQLKVGQLGETIQVTDNAPLIDESPAVGTTVNRQFVENLPLNGRSFQSLFELTPGVIITPSGNGEPGQFSVNGQRTNANYVTVDGVSANAGVLPGLGLGQSVTGSVSGFAATGGTNNLVSVDALQEFKIQTSSFAPEFGRTPGAQV
ncbi:MAG: carboxypeptidase regulatory-like domain-containing protein, partial [Pyrinomonadaceae bacterium]